MNSGAFGREVVITGIGIVTPIGVGRDSFWQAALCGTGAVAKIPDHWRNYFKPACCLWAPLPGIDFALHDISRIEQLQLDKAEMISLTCAREAMSDARYTLVVNNRKKNTYSVQGIEPHRFGVFVGSGIGGLSSVCASQAFHCGELPVKKLDEMQSRLAATDSTSDLALVIEDLKRHLRLPVRFNPMTVAMSMPNGCSAMPGIKYGLAGPNMTCAAACAAGTMAIGQGFRSIVQGECDAALVGGAEYLGDDFGGGFRGFDIAGALVRNCNDPEKANRPFDRDRSGFLLAEGGGALFVIEEKKHALDRGANIYATITGFGQSFDAYSMMAMEPDGRAAERMVRSALDDAGIGPADVDYINAHGTGTVLNDEIESALIERLFGEKPLVNSTKSLTGHTIGASGAIGAAVTALSLFHQTTHVSKNIENPIRNLTFVKSAGTYEIRHALTQSFAFGGHNACLVLSRYEG